MNRHCPLLRFDIADPEISTRRAWHQLDRGKRISAVTNIHRNNTDCVDSGSSERSRYLVQNLSSNWHEYVRNIHASPHGINLAK